MFLDSSGYLALVNPRDVYHDQAASAAQRIAAEGWHTFTTNYVIAEAHALFLVRLGYQHATAFLRQFDQTTTTVVRVGPADEARAR